MQFILFMLIVVQMILPTSLGDQTVNHDVLAVGYNEHHWKIMNTWGCAWGSGGFAELPRCLNDLGGVRHLKVWCLLYHQAV